MSNWRVAPIFVVRDVAASVQHYRDALGFEVAGTFGEPLEMAFVERGGVQLMLQDAEGKPTPGPNADYKSVAWDALLWVPDAAALFDDVSARGADLSGPPERTFYGTTEFQARDPDGHVLCFCQLGAT